MNIRLALIPPEKGLPRLVCETIFHQTLSEEMDLRESTEEVIFSALDLMFCWKKSWIFSSMFLKEN